MAINLCTILLVDDEPAVLTLVGTVLEREGYRVVCTTDPRVALKLAAGPQGAPDLLLTDVNMPELCGPVLAESFRDAFPGARILYMTAHSSGTDRDHGIPPGADVLRKPFRIRELVERVRIALGHRSAAAAC